MLATWKIVASPALRLSQVHTYFMFSTVSVAAALHNLVCVAADNVSDDVGSVVVWGTLQREYSTHAAYLDHGIAVKSIASSIALQCFASGSLDGVIKLWNTRCELVSCR